MKLTKRMDKWFETKSKRFRFWFTILLVMLVFFMGVVYGLSIPEWVETFTQFYYELEALEVDVPVITYTDYDRELMEKYTPQQLQEEIEKGAVDYNSLSPDFQNFLALLLAEDNPSPKVISNPKTGGIYVIP